MSDVKLVPIQYRVHNGETPTGILIASRGTTWAIVMEVSGIVLNYQGEWEYEPIPSNRTEEFLIRCRYDTVEEAQQYLERYLATLV